MATKTPHGEHVASSPIFKKFLGKAEEYLSKPLRIKQLLNDAYQKASEKNELGGLAHDVWETVQTLIRLVRSASSGEYTGLPGTTIAAAVAVLIYFLSPIDVIPDFIPVIGLLDDVALVAWFTSTLKEQLDKFAEWEKTRPVVVEDNAVTADSSPASGSAAPTAQVQTPTQAAPAPTKASAQKAPESAKQAGTTDLDSAATPDQAAQSDVVSSTTTGSRQPNTATPDTGGNVR